MDHKLVLIISMHSENSKTKVIQSCVTIIISPNGLSPSPVVLIERETMPHLFISNYLKHKKKPCKLIPIIPRRPKIQTHKWSEIPKTWIIWLKTCLDIQLNLNVKIWHFHRGLLAAYTRLPSPYHIYKTFCNIPYSISCGRGIHVKPSGKSILLSGISDSILY